VVLVHMINPWGGRWQLTIGVRENGTIRVLSHAGRMDMKGSSVEIALPLASVKDLLTDLESTRYRVTSWTSKGTSPLADVRETEAGFFSLPGPNIKPPDEQLRFLAEIDGHQFFISKRSATWEEASSLCKGYGGHLVTITSDAENQALMKPIREKNIHKDNWIGLTKVNGTWSWVTGEKADFTYWHAGQPDNWGGSQTAACIALDPTHSWLRDPGKWDDNISSAANLFILEME
jgi:hypothetical protein